MEDDVVHVIEDDPAEEKRKDRLDAAIREQGEPQPEVEPSPPRAAGSAQTMLAEAAKHSGYRESGENDTKFNRWLGRIVAKPPYPHDHYGYPWCASFLSYCLAHSGNAGAVVRTASCLAGVGWFQARGRWGTTPHVGDFVYYGPDGRRHVELVTSVGPNTVRTIGGNTRGSLAGSYFNGVGVYEKTVKRSSPSIAGYGRPAYGTAGGGPGVTPITSIRSIRQQQQAVNALGYAPKLQVDGEWGPKTEAGVKWLQRKVGAGVDGEWGARTEAKYKAHTGT